MNRFNVAALWICISNIMGKGTCRGDKVFAIVGCNATLEWTLGNTMFEAYITTIQVFDASGIRIVWKEDSSCDKVDDPSIYCTIWNRTEEWLLSVLLINVTMAKSGGYQGQINYGLGNSKNFTKDLIVVDKPHIRKHTKAVINEPLDITCIVTGILTGIKYRWKLNETDLNSTGRVHANLSVLMFQSLWTVDKYSIFSCEACKENSCCIKSETFTLDPYYGPFNVTLSLQESVIYLHENETFSIKCFAECNPVCIFWWEGYLISDNEELVISSFDSNMAGGYICYARNFETDVKAKSKPIFLHQVKVSSVVSSIPEENEVSTFVSSISENSEGFRLEFLWMGVVIIVVNMIIVVCIILVRHWRKNASRRIGQEDACRRSEGSENPDIQRKLICLQNLSDQTKIIRNHARANVTLPIFSQSSNTVERQTRNRKSSDYSASKSHISEKDIGACSMRGATDGSRLAEIEKVKGDNIVIKVDYNICTIIQTQNNSQENLGPTFKEDTYSTIDEAALSAHVDTILSGTDETSHEEIRHTEYEYDYAGSINIYHTETDDVHLTDDTYMTPINDPARSNKIYQEKEPDLLGIDQTYITPIDDSSCPVEICQMEETDGNETCETYITPIS